MPIKHASHIQTNNVPRWLKLDKAYPLNKIKAIKMMGKNMAESNAALSLKDRVIARAPNPKPINKRNDTAILS